MTELGKNGGNSGKSAADVAAAAGRRGDKGSSDAANGSHKEDGDSNKLFRFEIGSHARCAHTDGKLYPVTIEDRAVQEDKPRYKVHYQQWARRHDTWVDEDKLKEPEHPSTTNGSRRRARRREVSTEPTVSPLGGLQPTPSDLLQMANSAKSLDGMGQMTDEELARTLALAEAAQSGRRRETRRSWNASLAELTKQGDISTQIHQLQQLKGDEMDEEDSGKDDKNDKSGAPSSSSTQAAAAADPATMTTPTPPEPKKRGRTAAKKTPRKKRKRETTTTGSQRGGAATTATTSVKEEEEAVDTQGEAQANAPPTTTDTADADAKAAAATTADTAVAAADTTTTTTATSLLSSGAGVPSTARCFAPTCASGTLSLYACYSVICDASPAVRSPDADSSEDGEADVSPTETADNDENDDDTADGKSKTQTKPPPTPAKQEVQPSEFSKTYVTLACVCVLSWQNGYAVSCLFFLF